MATLSTSHSAGQTSRRCRRDQRPLHLLDLPWHDEQSDVS